MAKQRAGRYIQQLEGYRAFIPSPLPPEPPEALDPGLVGLLAEASAAVGRLDGVGRTVPNVDLFVAMYVRREAVESSQIEGTQSSMDDLLAYELDPLQRSLPEDVEEVVNYVAAMNHGLARLGELPLSLRLVREIHGLLLRSGRGQERTPGEFRTSQNWIGPAGATLRTASFIPPPPEEMRRALGDLERFLHADHGRDPLIESALVHAHFETIHPFLDGNGRVGRLLITFLLVHRGVLTRPLLYLSAYFKQHREEYYGRLNAIRDEGDWEGWLAFFLRGVRAVADEAVEVSHAIVDLRRELNEMALEQLGGNGARAVDVLFARPFIDVALLAGELDVTYATANRLVAELERLGVVREITGGRRNRVFRFDAFLELFPA